MTQPFHLACVQNSAVADVARNIAITTRLTNARMRETKHKGLMLLVTQGRGLAPKPGNPDVVFAKVDTEANQDLAGAANIMSIPTLMAFRDGILVFSQAGALPAAALDDLLGQVRALDMDEVRASVEAQRN